MSLSCTLKAVPRPSLACSVPSVGPKLHPPNLKPIRTSCMWLYCAEDWVLLLSLCFSSVCVTDHVSALFRCLNIILYDLKRSSDAKFTFQFVWMCVGSVCTHPSYNYRNPPSVFLIPILKSPFSNQAVLRFLSQWHSSGQAAPTDSWLTRSSYLRPALSELRELSAIVSTPVQGKTRYIRLSDWDALLLDVIMNIAVVIYSRHLSHWRRRGLTLLSLLSERADPQSA